MFSGLTVAGNISLHIYERGTKKTIQTVNEFFIPMKIPTVTHQEKKITVKNQKVIVYENERLKDARQKFEALLSKYTPEETIQSRPIRLTVKWCFQADRLHQHGTPKITKPDTDNLIKLLKDVMTNLGYWKDDALIASEINEKFYSDIPGLYIKIEVMQ